MADAMAVERAGEAVSERFDALDSQMDCIMDEVYADASHMARVRDERRLAALMACTLSGLGDLHARVESELAHARSMHAALAKIAKG